jgi:23S rRNA pseudouridine1911/1915/1917 synthase
VTAFLIHHYENLPSQSHFMRAWLIHRLDKDTQGFLIIAKTEAGLQYFKTLFQRKSESWSPEEKESVPLKKMYRARCESTPSSHSFLKSLTLQNPYLISQMVHAKVPHSTPKLWLTKIISYQSVPWFPQLFDLFLEILTWRTHQIRFHLSQLNLPIQWDPLYGTGKYPETNLQLKAYRLEFLDLYWNYRVFERYPLS